MKKIIFVLLLFSCQSKVETKKEEVKIQSVAKDSSSYKLLVAEKKYDSLVQVILKTFDSTNNELKLSLKQNDSLRFKLFRANYKLNKVRFYVRICMKNPSQDKFLKGWVRRTVEE
ncbi:MAG: putative peptidoglycan-binding domain-containing protein [Chitinophagia bacterium]